MEAPTCPSSVNQPLGPSPTLVQNGIKSIRDLSGAQRRYLELFAQSYRVVERLEPLDTDGSANGNMTIFLAAVNTAGRALQRFEEALGHQQKQRDRNAVLDELSKYRGKGGGA
jgi:hypothetical protein